MYQTNKHPENWKQILEYMPEYAEHGVFVWGSTIYNPKGYNIDPGLLKRCEMYSEQQYDFGGDKWKYKIIPKQRIRDWWTCYLKDKAFWLAMEIPACQKQYWEVEKVISDRNKLDKFVYLLAKDLEKSGKISVPQAMKAIKNPTLYKFI